MQIDFNIQIDGITEDLKGLLLRVADCAADAEDITLPCTACVVLTDDANIRSVNREKRNIDRGTDVISFPSIDYPQGQTAHGVPFLLRSEWDDSSNACMLGDIVISVPMAKVQAKAFGHSTNRELCYLLAHGLFHLFGYDHQTRKGRNQMRKIEENALAMAGQSRVSDDEMIQSAKDALKNAYAPYSRFRVGASLLCSDGRVYTGCNIENASFGLTNCAERTALFKAVSEGATSFDTIAIVADKAAPWPCGACRQVLNEFSSNLRVLVSWGADNIKETSLSELLPHAFSPISETAEYLGKDHI